MVKRYRRLAGLTAAAFFLGVGVPAAAMAAHSPANIHALPDPPGAPETDTFLVTVPHHQAVPSRAVFRFTSLAGHQTTVTEPFKKLNQYQWETIFAAKSEGHLTLDVYTAGGHLIAKDSYPVSRSKNNPFGRIVIGALFIGVSLWFWRRQQKFYRRS